MIRLNVQSPGFPARVLVLDQPLVSLGRNPRADVVLGGDDQVSWNHLVIEQRPQGFVVRDLGSLNRTLVNRQEIEEHVLRTGDVIEVGSHRIEFQDMQPLLPARSAPAAETGSVPRWFAWGGPVVGVVFVLQLVLVGAQVAAWMQADPLPRVPSDPVPLQTLSPPGQEQIQSALNDLVGRVRVMEDRIDRWELDGQEGPVAFHRRLEALRSEVDQLSRNLEVWNAMAREPEPAEE